MDRGHPHRRRYCEDRALCRGKEGPCDQVELARAAAKAWGGATAFSVVSDGRKETSPCTLCEPRVVNGNRDGPNFDRTSFLIMFHSCLTAP
jgi:hypothetical protein